MRYGVGALVALLLVAACDRAAGPPAQPSPLVMKFDARVAADGQVAFLSHDGKWIGTDSDLAIVFRPKGAATLTVYGYAVQQYEGSYRIADDGEVTARFEKLPWKWPAMMLGDDGRSFVLRPKDPTEHYRARWTFRSARGQNETPGNDSPGKPKEGTSPSAS